jgi:hypothetical protein
MKMVIEEGFWKGLDRVVRFLRSDIFEPAFASYFESPFRLATLLYAMQINEAILNLLTARKTCFQN